MIFRNFKILIKDSYNRHIKPTYKQGLSVLTDAKNVYQYLIKIHQLFNSYKESNQRSRIKKIPFLLPSTSHFIEKEFVSQNYEETVYETEVNGYNILYQFEKPILRICYYIGTTMKSVKCGIGWGELISFCKCKEALATAKDILAWKLIELNERANPVFFERPKLYFPY